MRKLGTLLYRTNGDLLTSISLALHNLAIVISQDTNNSMQHRDVETHVAKPSSKEDDINSHMHQQVRLYLAADMAVPYRFDQVYKHR